MKKYFNLILQILFYLTFFAFIVNNYYMDSLINALNSFQFVENKSEDVFDQLISDFKINLTEDSDTEWETITSNYSKLLYLNHLIDIFEFPETKQFLTILNKVLCDIDKKNNQYLHELTWEEEEHEQNFVIIQNLFEQSLYCSKPIEKLKLILESYRILIPIIEGYRKEKFVEYIDDQKFLSDIYNVNKRRRI